MIGDKVGVLTGSVTGTRVMSSPGQPTVETTAELNGELGGVAATMLATYSSTVRADGYLQGDCPHQGLFMTPEGVATFTAGGLGWSTGDGSAVSFRGALYLTTAPAALEDLTKVALVYEWEVGADGVASLSLWEWK